MWMIVAMGVVITLLVVLFLIDLVINEKNENIWG
jgi:hypothetical protein